MSTKNRDIPDEIRQYFKEQGIDADEVFSELSMSYHNGTDVKDCSVEQLLQDMDAKNNNTFILLFTQLFELRKQVKTTQEGLAEISKQLEKNFKDLTSRIG
jgi:hypothetical protein